ncbi:MAG TPA: hypothetical protein VH677_04390 [Nitrososphaera sp.]
MRASSGTGNVGRSMAKHRKLVGIAGVALMAIGTWGMIMVGSSTLQAIDEGAYNSERGEMFQLNSYVFLFALVAGLVALIYAGIVSQEKNAPASKTA